MNNYLPVMLLKDLIILPNQEIKVETVKSDQLITVSNKHHNGNLLLVCPTDTLEEEPSITDLPTIGVVGIIKNIILLAGPLRFELRSYGFGDRYFTIKLRT